MLQLWHILTNFVAYFVVLDSLMIVEMVFVVMLQE